MLKNILFVLIIALVSSCSTSKNVNTNTLSVEKSTETIVKNTTISPDIKRLDLKEITHYASTITQKDLKKHVTILASDEFEGRMTGEKGQKMAANYMKEFYKKIGVEPGITKTKKYFQTIPKKFLKGRSNGDTENVLGFIYGSEKPEELIIISAHYDHLGIKGNKVYNGADDNCSGTSAVLEIAQAFRKAVEEGKGPKRSILFINFTAEELGLFGSSYYTTNPVYPLKNTVVNLNIDMVGRVDDRHKDNPNFIYLIGADKISTELHHISEAVNKKYTHLELDYKYNDENDPNRFYYRSDHYNFAKNGIPIIFYFNGVHDDYHKESDTVDKINFEILEKRTKLVFFTAWEIANREERIKID
ncbi:MAG: M28 family metallopeptidase [Flavobacteriaceae bacterium]|nr:M28 family metallopeptidase [Flavobacteriaceae bacterium]